MYVMLNSLSCRKHSEAKGLTKTSDLRWNLKYIIKKNLIMQLNSLFFNT